MKQNNHKVFFIFVTVITIIIILFQGYWSYQIYQANKAEYIFNVEKAFDDAVDQYYFQIGKSDAMAIMNATESTNDSKTEIADFFKKSPINNLESFLKNVDSTEGGFSNIISSGVLDTVDNFKAVVGKEALDENNFSSLRKNQITIRINRDSINFELLQKITDSIFNTNHLNSRYNLYHYKSNTAFDSLNLIPKTKNLISYSSNSEYLSRNEMVEIKFNNTNKQAFLKGAVGLILSLLLSLTILASIVRLIKTINKQKQLSKIKDDFISNITHEFKTPIATVSAAIEALDKFNFKDDVEKTKKYLQISNQQLLKLDTMVEKLLETSALDEDKIRLNKEIVDVLPMIKNLLTKHKLMSNTKTFKLVCTLPSLKMNVDLFYFSTVISNLLDNAEKYGGPNIKVEISKNNSKTTIAIEDNGNTLKQSDASFIFDKFSRISNGNIHEIKGNGIGLYFVKRIIEKHGGTIQLKVNESSTAFIILA